MDEKDVKRYVRTKEGKIFDEQDKGVACFTLQPTAPELCEQALLSIYYYDRHRGQYIDVDGYGINSRDDVNEEDIVMFADRPEDLCDVFVLVEEGMKPVIMDKHDLVAYVSSTSGYEGFGGICLPTGIKYIVKLNDEDKFELWKGPKQ